MCAGCLGCLAGVSHLYTYLILPAAQSLPLIIPRKRGMVRIVPIISTRPATSAILHQAPMRAASAWTEGWFTVRPNTTWSSLIVCLLIEYHKRVRFFRYGICSHYRQPRPRMCFCRIPEQATRRLLGNRRTLIYGLFSHHHLISKASPMKHNFRHLKT